MHEYEINVPFQSMRMFPIARYDNLAYHYMRQIKTQS